MDKIMPYLEQLAQKLGVAIEHLWSVLVRQSLVEGISQLVLCTLYIILTILIIKYSPKLYKFCDDKYKDLQEDRKKNGTGYSGSYSTSSTMEDFFGFLRGFSVVVFGAFLIVFVMLSIVNLTEGIKYVANPEYYALQKILETIK